MVALPFATFAMLAQVVIAGLPGYGTYPRSRPHASSSTVTSGVSRGTWPPAARLRSLSTERMTPASRSSSWPPNAALPAALGIVSGGQPGVLAASTHWQRDESD